MGNLKTPIIRPLRTQGGTFYTFASAIEDVGLNIAERKNKVRLSHYALLDIPMTDESNNSEIINRFNFYSIPDAMGKRYANIIDEEEYGDSIQPALQIQNINTSIAQSFMSYALNMETSLLNDKNYDYSRSLTVSERVFWKWLKESGAIRWYKDENGNIKEGDSNKNDYTDTIKYTNVVKSIGKIDGVAQRSSDYGMYNEVYVNIPASFGTTEPIIFISKEDNNYKFNSRYYGENNLIGRGGDDDINNSDNDSSVGILNMGFYDYSSIIKDISEYYTFNNAKGVWSDKYANNLIDDNVNLYLTDSMLIDGEDEYDTVSVNINNDGDFYPVYTFRRSKYDCMQLDILLNNEIYENSTYDSLSTSEKSEDYQFNAILVYYSIYDNNDSILSTNLYGVYFIDSPKDLSIDNEKMSFKLPILDKVRSGGDGFGTSYSFRLNMRSSSMYDNADASLYDNSSSENSIVSDFNNVVANLNESIKLLGKHTKYTHILSEKYNEVYYNIKDITNKLEETNKNVNRILNNKEYDLNTNSLTTSQLILDSSLLKVNDNDFNINVNSNNIINYNNLDNEINISPTLQISELCKKLNISNNNNVNLNLNDVDIFKYINIVPKYNEVDKINSLDLEIRNDVDLSISNFGIKDQKIDIMTILAYLLYKTK